MSNAGERNGRASLNEKIVRQIKSATGTQQQIARRFDVSRSTVSDIRRGRSWRCLDDRAGEDVTFVLPDLHIPYHLPKELAACLRLAQSIGPKRIVLIGDVIDCMTISRFDKNPARKATLADEINTTRKFLSDLRLRFPDAEIHYCEGNHEDRLRKYLWRKSPELAGLQGLSIPDLLHLSDLKIAWQPQCVRIGKLAYTHANRIRKPAGQTARVMSDEWISSIICGHSHRQGRCPRTTPAGLHDAYEAGCLCDYRLLDYVDSVPNWQVGAATVTTFSDGNFAVDFVAIVDGKVFWRGRCVDKVK